MNNLVFCENCNTSREYYVEEGHMEYHVKNESFVISGHQAKCAVCNHETFHFNLEKSNQAKAFDGYRKKHRLVFVNEIIETREKYGLAQHEFSLLLGIGENTIARYERGTLPSAENSLLIRQAANPILMKKLIETNGNSINSSTREALLKGLQLEKEIEEDLIEPIMEMISQEPDEENGFLSFNWSKFKQMVAFFAKEQSPHFTSMCKLMFYSDFYHFKKFGRSISGAKYVCMDYGPCPDRHQTLFESVPNVQIEKSPFSEKGRILKYIDTNETFHFTSEEFNTLYFVNEKFGGVRSRDISEFSHEEKAWKDTDMYSYISYEYAEELDPERKIKINI
ncbi:TPA: DUF4065 domain-containing protein [Bacillus cereus]|nr:DUF4065 domain-containing protein [Bacillus cereus]